MKLRSILPLLACLLVFSACGDDDGDGGGEAVGGSCRYISNDGTMGSCQEFPPGFMASVFQKSCMEADGSQWKNEACPRANAVGYCEVDAGGAGAPTGSLVSSTYYYDATGETEDVFSTGCENGGGTWKSLKK